MEQITIRHDIGDTIGLTAHDTGHDIAYYDRWANPIASARRRDDDAWDFRSTGDTPLELTLVLYSDVACDLAAALVARTLTDTGH